VRHYKLALKAAHRRVAVELVRPDVGGAPPLLVILHGMWGLNDHVRDLAWRCARLGWAVLIPTLHGGRLGEALAPERLIALERDLGVDLHARPLTVPPLELGASEWQRQTLAALHAIHSPQQRAEWVADTWHVLRQVPAQMRVGEDVACLGLGTGGPVALDLGGRPRALIGCVSVCGGVPDQGLLARLTTPALVIWGDIRQLTAGLAVTTVGVVCEPGQVRTFDAEQPDFLDGRHSHWSSEAVSEAWSHVVEFLGARGGLIVAAEVGIALA